MKGNYGKRFLSMMLSAIMVLGMLPVNAFATNDGITIITGPCEHHVCSEENCGYVKAVEGTTCTHADTHDGCAYVEGNSCECTAEEGAELTHAEGCGYVEAVECDHDCVEGVCYTVAVEGADCAYECEDCIAAWTEESCDLTDGCELLNGHPGDCTGAGTYEVDEDEDSCLKVEIYSWDDSSIKEVFIFSNPKTALKDLEAYVLGHPQYFGNEEYQVTIYGQGPLYLEEEVSIANLPMPDVLIVLASTDAELTADDDMKVTTNVDGYKVVYEGGTYKLAADEDTTYVAQVGENKYTDLQEAIKAAAPAGTVEILNDVTVDKWIMFAESLSIGNGNLITLNINGLTIDGNGHTLTVNSIESAGNGNRLFYDAQNLNINDLTIEYVDAAANQGGIGLQSGEINNVTFIGGGYGVLPGAGEITIEECTFKTNSTAIYFEAERDNLVVTKCAFTQPENVNVILLRGDVEFTDNTINSGRTVNVVSGSPVVTGNNFNNVRLKVYNVATATISDNEINVLEFSDATEPKSTFAAGNNLSDEAKAALNAVMPAAPVATVNDVAYTSLEEALKAITDEDTVKLLDDITISDTWDCRNNGAKITASNVTIDGNGKTLKLTGEVKDNNWNTVFRFEGEEALVTNLTIDVSEATGVQRGITSKLNLTVINCTFIGNNDTAKYAVIYGEGAGDAISGLEVNVLASTFENWSYGVSDNRNGQDAEYVDISNNTFTNANVLVSASETVYFDNNTMDGGSVNISSYSVPNELYVRAMNTQVDTAKDNKIVAATVANAYGFQTPVAEVGGKLYLTLQAAINAAQAGDEIVLLADVTENVTLTEKTGLYYTIDGNGKTMNGTMSVKSLSDTNDNRRITIKNIKFVDTTDANVDFIKSVDTNHYPRLTVEGCSFTGSGNDGDVAIRLKSSHSVIIKDCTGTGLHSFLQNTSGWNLTIENVTVTESKSGLALGTVQGVTVKDCDITVDGYGIRMDAQYNNNAVIESNKVSAFIPVVVRKAEVDSNVEFKGTNTFDESNTDGLWCAIGTSEYETAGTMPTAATGKVVVEVNDAGLDKTGIYGAYAAAEINGTKYVTLQAAIDAAQAGETITLLGDVTEAEAVNIPNGANITIDLQGKTLNGYFAPCTPASLTIKNGSIVNTNSSFSAIEINAGELTLTNVNIESARHAVRIDGAVEATINGGTYKLIGTKSQTQYVLNISGEANVTIKDGTFTGPAGTVAESGAAVNVKAGATVTIEGGDFSGGKNDTLSAAGTLTVTGGTFDQDPTAYVADGYEVTPNTDGTWGVEAKPVAKVGDAEYSSIDEALDAWTNGKTLTLLADVTLTDVIQLSSTEKHVLDLGTYTMTAASGKDAIQIVNNGRSSAGTALEIKADATNPGGITASGKAIVRTTGKSGVKDRPIISFRNGVFNASYIVYHSGSNGTNCPQFYFYDGEYTGTIYTNRTLNLFYGGTFHGSLMMSVDSSAYTLISGGTFKQLSNLYMSALNSDKFMIASHKCTSSCGHTPQVFDREVYVNEDGYYVVAAAQPTAGFEASVAKTPGTNDYLKYSKVATEGKLNYTDVETALKNNASADVTIYAENVDLTGSSFKGTLLIEDELTVTFAEGTTPAWTVATDVEGQEVTYTDTVENGVVTRTYKLFAPVAKIGETGYASLDDAVAAAKNGDELKILAAGTYDVPTGKNITITGAVDGVVFDNIGAKNMGSANVTFNHVTFNYADNSTYKGLQHSGNLVYNNCIINGQVFLYGESETFNNCTFNQNSADAYNVWTYGAKEVAFNECTFNSAGKSVLIYSEDSTLVNNVAVTKSTFNATSAVEGKAAIEMDSSLTAGINLTVDDKTTANGFDTGNVSQNSLWNNKKGNEGKNNDITVTVDDVVVLEPIQTAEINGVYYTTINAALEAAVAGDTVKIYAGNYAQNLDVKKAITVVGETDNAGENLVNISGKLNVTADGASVKNLNFNNGSGSGGYINAKDVLIEGCTVAGGNGFRSCYTSGKVTFKDSTITGATYGIHFDGNAGGNIEIDNCVITGWTSFARTITNVAIKDTTFEDGNYNLLRFYQNAQLTNVTFPSGNYSDYDGSGMRIDSGEGGVGMEGITLTFTGCKTADGSDLAGAFTDEVAAASVVMIDEVRLMPICAMIGEVEYRGLQAAIDAAQAGDTVTILRDIELTETVEVAADDKITIDLNGKVIDGTEKVKIALVSSGKLTLKDSSAEQTGAIKAGIGTVGNTVNICAGEFTMESGSIYSLNNAIFIDKDAAVVTIKGGKITAEPTTNNSAVFYISSTSETTVNIEDGELVGYNGILLWNNTTINMTGGSIEAKGSLGIQGNGSKDNTEINISGDASVSGYYAAIYHPQGGELNISENATLTGWTGVVVKGGTVNISGGTISGTGAAGTYTPVSSGFQDTGDGLYVEHYDNSTNSENYGTPVVTVTGGTFTSANAKAVASYANTNNSVEALTGFISGGSFDDASAEGLLAEGCGLTFANGFFTVIEAPVANVDGKDCKTMAEAVEEAIKTGETIYIKRDATVGKIEIPDDANVTIDLKGFTLKGYIAPCKPAALTVQNGSIVNNNSGVSAIEINAGELVLTNVKVQSERHAIRIDGAVEAVINSGEYSVIGTNKGTYHAVNVSGAANVTIKDGTFTGPAGTTADSGAAVNVQSGATVTIEGGDFSGGKNDTLASVGTLGITGGSFDQDPTAYVADGYVAVKNETDGTWTVGKDMTAAMIEGKEGTYTSLQAAINAATAGDKVVLKKDITEDVTVDKSLTIDGAGKTYTGMMTLKADTTIKNVNFDGKGCNDYAVVTRGADYLTIEDCTAKNSYGFVQLASGTALTKVKNVTISDMNYGVKIDYSNAVVLENVEIDAAVAAVLNSNFGTKTITIKDSDLSILGTWTRNNTTKTTYVFEGENAIDEFVIDAEIDSFKLAAGATLTAPNDVTVTTDVAGNKVVYENGVYKLVEMVDVAKIGNTPYATVAEALAAAKSGDTVVLLKDAEETNAITVWTGITLDLNGYTLEAPMAMFVNGSIIKDSTDGSGLLKVNKNYVVLPESNGQMPLYDVAEAGYRFFDLTVANKGYRDEFTETPTATGTMQFRFRPVFTNTKAYELLAANGASGCGVKIGFELTWTGMTSEPQVFLVNDNYVKGATEAMAQGRNITWYLTLSGYEHMAGKTLTGNPMVISGTGVAEYVDSVMEYVVPTK